MKNSEHKNQHTHRFSIVSIAVIGCLVIAVILIIGTFTVGRTAGNDTKDAVRNVSLLYLSELAGRREQVVYSELEENIRNLDVAVGMLDKDDLSSIESLQAYQLRIKQLYDLEKFAFVDSTGLIYTSRGTRNDIDQYDIDYMNMSEPEVSIKNLNTNDKKVVIAMSLDNLKLLDRTLVVCFMEIDMDNLLRNVSIQSNNNTTFCNIYTKDGIALTDMVLGGLASEDNLLDAMSHASYEKGYSYDGLKEDFAKGNSGEVSFEYNGIIETLYYVPVRDTDWMLTYLIRESIIGEQINSISDSIIRRSLIQSVLTAVVLIGMFVLIFIQQRQAVKAAIDKEVTETENRMRQEELEEQLAMQEELASKSDELEKALIAAEEASMAKSGFVSNMSHEIRTPITAILGMNEMIRRECNDENILSYAEKINSAGVSLLGIISDILDFSKIEAGRMEVVNDKYALASMINDLYNLIRFRAEAKGLAVKVSVDSTLPSVVVGDELKLKQVIANLLTNAIKYTEKGEVTITYKVSAMDEENNRVCLHVDVSDTGIGIHEDEMDKLFVPFDRLDVMRTRSIEGAGLGLTITRQLLHMMGSELKVESIYDRGSSFFFDIWQDISDPAQIGDFDPTSQKYTVRSHDDDKHVFTAPGKRILVVDDMPMNLQVLSGLLKRSQMIIDTASSGEECINKMGENDYDIVFMDYRMPRMDGIDTLVKLKENYPAKVASTPIVALTASATAGDRDKLLESGFTDFLSKPVVISDMEEVMKKYVGEDGITDISYDDVVAEAGISEIPDMIRGIPELDIDSGIDYCGDEEDYLYALRTYADSVEDKAGQLELSLAQDRMDDYVLIVHSLKSMSKSIGANELSEKAKRLEQAGRDGDMDVVKADSSEFLLEYRELGSKLDSCLKKKEVREHLESLANRN